MHAHATNILACCDAPLCKKSPAHCRASYCEIYNEALYDLLRWTKQQLSVRWDAGKGFHVPDLMIRDCPAMGDMMNVRSPFIT